MTEIQNSKPVLVIEYWNLRFVCDLVLGVWDFINSLTPKHLPMFTGKTIALRPGPELQVSHVEHS